MGRMGVYAQSVIVSAIVFGAGVGVGASRTHVESTARPAVNGATAVAAPVVSPADQKRWSTVCSGGTRVLVDVEGRPMDLAYDAICVTAGPAAPVDTTHNRGAWPWSTQCSGASRVLLVKGMPVAIASDDTCPIGTLEND